MVTLEKFSVLESCVELHGQTVMFPYIHPLFPFGLQKPTSFLSNSTIREPYNYICRSMFTSFYYITATSAILEADFHLKICLNVIIQQRIGWKVR